MKAVIIAGGFGTRLQNITKSIAAEHQDLYNHATDIPKPMAVIDGIPVLEREIVSLREQGITKIILTVSYLADVIIDYFGDGSGKSRATGEPFGVEISYFKEETPLGNVGALYKIYDELPDLDDPVDPNDFLLLIADSVFDIDFNRFMNFHREHHALATLFTHPNSHPFDSSIVVTKDSADVELFNSTTSHYGMRSSASGPIVEWLNKEDERSHWYKNNVNAGLHILNRKILDITVQAGRVEPENIGTVVDGKTVKVDLDRQILKPLAGKTDEGGNAYLYAYSSPEYVKDMGTEDRYAVTVRDYRSGLVQAKNLSKPQKAIFLDRDGTINNYVGFLRKAEDFSLIPGISSAIKRINASGYLAIIITNQPVIARGEVSVEELNDIHNKLETLLGQDGAYIDGLYYCPHHTDKGFEGEVTELKMNCDCRKPKAGLIEHAAKDFNIDVKNSYFFGDGKNDVLCGINAGVKATGLYVGTGSETQVKGKEAVDYGQSYTVQSLEEFLDLIGV